MEEDKSHVFSFQNSKKKNSGKEKKRDVPTFSSSVALPKESASYTVYSNTQFFLQMAADIHVSAATGQQLARLFVVFL